MEFAEAVWAVDKAASKLNTSLFGQSSNLVTGSDMASSSKTKQAKKKIKMSTLSPSSNTAHQQIKGRTLGKAFHQTAGSDDEKMSKKEKKHWKEKQRKWRKKHGASKPESTVCDISEEVGSSKRLSKKAGRLKTTVSSEDITDSITHSEMKPAGFTLDELNSEAKDQGVSGREKKKAKKRKLKEMESQNAFQPSGKKAKASAPYPNNDKAKEHKGRTPKEQFSENQSVRDEANSTEDAQSPRKKRRNRKKKNNSKKNKYKHLALNNKNAQETGAQTTGENGEKPKPNVKSSTPTVGNAGHSDLLTGESVKRGHPKSEAAPGQRTTQTKKQKKDSSGGKTDASSQRLPQTQKQSKQQKLSKMSAKVRPFEEDDGSSGISDVGEFDSSDLDFDSESDLTSDYDSSNEIDDTRNPSKQKEMINNSESVLAKDTKLSKPLSLVDKAREKLNAARFRFLNEQLYTTSGREALKMFKADKDAFDVYHHGYQAQVSRWPLNPLDIIIQQLKNKAGCQVIADFGCGDARLAETLTHKTVHSFDLVAMKPCVTVCDIAKVPLASGSVDAAVFCLSLMGTNLSDYLCEANRVLKNGGLMKVAEVVSRFDNINSFVNKVEKLGFQLLKKTMLSKMFYLFTFRKVKNTQQKSAPEIQLKPCYYKRR